MALFSALPTAALASNIWYVDGLNGNDNNDCRTRQTACKTIGHAISLASSGDTIGIGPATYKENLTISISLNIFGSDAATTIVDGGGIGTVFVISSTTANVKFSKLTIRNGHGNYGGGISNVGTLTVNNSTISGNIAADNGGGMELSYPGTVTINNSTITANSASYDGGGIENSGPTGLTINNSTISGNTAGGGGGIDLTHGGTAAINNSTITANTAFYNGYGGGVVSYDISSATFQNSIVASNNGGNCSGTTISTGYNLSSDGTCNFNGIGDMNNTNAKLGTLGNHGGPTQTIPLLEGSPAIDAGNPNGCTDGKGHLLKIDQRGYPRPDKEDKIGCDMGAYEKQSD